MDKVELQNQLYELRESLVAPYEAAQQAGDTAKMDMLTKVAGEIDRVLDEIAILTLAQLASRLTAFRKAIEKFDGLASDPLSGFLDLSVSQLKEVVAKLFADTEEEEVSPVLEEETGTDVDADAETAPGIGFAAPEPITDSSAGAIAISEAHLVALWKRSHFPIDTARGFILFGLRGCRPVDYSGTGFADSHEIILSDVNFATMNCTIGQWRPGDGLALFPGSTVPYGAIVKSKISVGGSGVNQLGRGRYTNYKAGWHKRKEGSNGHWALQQNCPITIQRTADDADFDNEDNWYEGYIAGDNIHCAFGMGAGAKIPDHRYSSAGCQVIAGTVKKGVRGSEAGPWEKFIRPFQKKHPGARTNAEYVLFDAREIHLMVATRLVGKTVILRYGSYGPLVKKLQRVLKGKVNPSLGVDGDFGVETFRTVREFQSDVFGEAADDGIVGPSTARKLGFRLPEFDFADAISGGSGYSDDGGGAGAGEPEEAGDAGDTSGSGGAALPELAWGKITNKRHGEGFKTKVLKIAKRLGTDPNYLMAVMAFETGDSFAPDKKNAAGSKATGLIQFMPKTAKGLGTTTAKLEKMSGVEQLEYVEKHFDSVRGGKKLPTLSDVYMAVLWPVAVGRSESYVLFEKSSDPKINKRYEQNSGLDVNKNGKITKAEATKKVQDRLVLGLKADRFG